MVLSVLMSLVLFVINWVFSALEVVTLRKTAELCGGENKAELHSLWQTETGI